MMNGMFFGNIEELMKLIIYFKDKAVEAKDTNPRVYEAYLDAMNKLSKFADGENWNTEEKEGSLK